MRAIGIDVGGTFTDLVAIDAAGRTVFAKSLSTPKDQSIGVDSDFANTVRPAASMATRSVKVPPTSIPIARILKASAP